MALPCGKCLTLAGRAVRCLLLTTTISLSENRSSYHDMRSTATSQDTPDTSIDLFQICVSMYMVCRPDDTVQSPYRSLCDPARRDYSLLPPRNGVGARFTLLIHTSDASCVKCSNVTCDREIDMNGCGTGCIGRPSLTYTLQSLIVSARAHILTWFI